MSVKSRAAAKVAAKTGAKAAPGIGQLMMILEGAPVAFEEGTKAYDIYMKGHREARKLAKQGKYAESYRVITAAQLKAQAAAVRGTGKTVVSAVVAREAAESMMPSRSRRNPMMNEGPLYQDVLAHLRALQWVSWTAHWTAAGPSYYGDHKLLQRIYEGKGGGPDINDQIDALGERMVAYFGPPSVNPEAIVDRVHHLTTAALQSSADPFESLLMMEMQLQQAIRRAWEANQASGEHMSLGIDDLLMGLANERETAIYLLRRRLGGRKPLSGHRPRPQIPDVLSEVQSIQRAPLDDSLTPQPLKAARPNARRRRKKRR